MFAQTTVWGLDNDHWAAIGAGAAAIGAAASIISCAALLVSLWFIYRQIKEMRMSTAAVAFSKAMDILQDEDRRKDRGVVFGLKGKPYASWSADEIAAGERVCHSYDQVGIMARAGMFPKELIVTSWGDSLRRIWPIVVTMVLDHQSGRDTDEYWNDFEWLAREAQKLRESRRPSKK